MIETWSDLSEFLTENNVTSSTPARLHCGGSVDHRLIGLLCRSWQPATTNIAIDLRVHVTLRPYETGQILVDIDGVGKQDFAAPHLPLSGPFALVSAIICYFGVHGLEIHIKTDFPFQSGLGGSGAVAVALIGAIHAAVDQKFPNIDQFPSIVKIAHNLEDSLFRNTGMQDQAAALYGGVNLWEWQYADCLNFRRQQLQTDPSILDRHILLAYTGRPHLQTRNGSQMLEKFKEAGALNVLVSISEEARKFAGSLQSRDHRAAGSALTAEYQLRSTLLPVLHPDDLELVDMAAKAHCGVSVTGNGGGGCIWAIGEDHEIEALKIQWLNALDRHKIGCLLPVKVTDMGLMVEIHKA